MDRVTDGWADRQTDKWTDKASYSDADSGLERWCYGGQAGGRADGWMDKQMDG